jgi:hypothetical protein
MGQVRVYTESKCLFTTEQLLEIYEQYKEASAEMIAEMALHDRISYKEGPSELHKSLIKAFEWFDFSELSLKQGQKLGMMMFDDYDNVETPSSFLMLFPLWMFPIVPKDIELTNIFGVRLPPFQNINKSGDTRNGLLSYGIMNYQFKYRKVLVEKHNSE